MRPATVPSWPARARSWMNSSPTGSSRIASSRSTTCCGEARLERVRPEPSTAWTPEPFGGRSPRPRAAPAAVVPAPPKSRAEQLDQHLGEEVVGVDVGGVDDLRSSVRRADQRDPFGVRRRRPEGDLRADLDPRRRAAMRPASRRQLRRVARRSRWRWSAPAKPELKSRPESGPM